MKHLTKALLLFIFLTAGVCGLALPPAMPASIDEIGAQDSAELSQELSVALGLYHQKEFAKALPIFRRISNRIQNIDLMSWIGASASRAGECDSAVEKWRINWSPVRPIRKSCSRVRMVADFFALDYLWGGWSC